MTRMNSDLVYGPDVCMYRLQMLKIYDIAIMDDASSKKQYVQQDGNESYSLAQFSSRNKICKYEYYDIQYVIGWQCQ